jgi:type 1 glutamine amidotransferase
VVVNWTTFVDATSKQFQALLESVRGGAGFVALHGGNATFWNRPEYLRMLGSRFVNHEPIKRFSVHVEQPSHPIVEGVSDFEIEDELFEIGGDTSKFEAFTDAFRERSWAGDVVRIGEGPLPPDVTVVASADGQLSSTRGCSVKAECTQRTWPR